MLSCPENERERAVNMLMAEGQLIKCCSHFFYVCWNFGLSSRWLFLQITLFNTFEPQEPLLLVYLWNFWSAAHSQSTGADIYFCGLCAYPRAGPASPYTIPCPMANVTSLGLPLPFPCPLIYKKACETQGLWTCCFFYQVMLLVV